MTPCLTAGLEFCFLHSHMVRLLLASVTRGNWAPPQPKVHPESLSVECQLAYLEGARDSYNLERTASWVQVVVCHWLGKEHGRCLIRYSGGNRGKRNKPYKVLEKVQSTMFQQPDKQQPVPVALEMLGLSVAKCFGALPHSEKPDCWSLLASK